MAIQAAWNKYEVAMLIDAYCQIQRGDIEKTEALKSLSESLRRMAKNSGVEIDSIYRNLNGMVWQYNFIEKAFQKSAVGNRAPTKLFTEMVGLYEHNYKEFEAILSTAQHMTMQELEKGNTKVEVTKMSDNREGFLAWLHENKKLKSSIGTIISVQDECSDYAYQHNISKRSFWDISDAIEYTNAARRLMSMRLFRVIHRKTALLFDKSFVYYGEFLKSKAEKETIVTIATPSEPSHILANDGDMESPKQTIVDNSFPLTASGSNTEITEDDCSNQIISLLSSHYVFGFRLESSIEMKRFRKYADSENIKLTADDELLKTKIASVGINADGKIYVFSEKVYQDLFNVIQTIISTGALSFFYESIVEYYFDLLNDSHITSWELLKEILRQNIIKCFPDVYTKSIYFGKNFISIDGRCTESTAVTKDIRRVWGEPLIRTTDELSKELRYIPLDYIKFHISAKHDFAWISENAYALIDHLKISSEEEEAIKNYVDEQCEQNGFASISDAPLDSVAEENFDLSQTGLYTAVFNKILYEDYHINGRIVTRDNTDLNAIELAKQFIGDRDECTFTEVNDKVTELTGAQYRYMAYEALYDRMIRVETNRFVAERHVKFDVESIDEAIAGFITDRFVAIKEITSFALFPMCGQAWTHYLLESYCIKNSKKYCLRVNVYNDKNVGIIAEQGVSEDYDSLLAIAAARAKIELSPETVGQFFVDSGYMGKRKFKALESIVEKAAAIREENK